MLDFQRSLRYQLFKNDQKFGVLKFVAVGLFFPTFEVGVLTDFKSR